MTSRRRAAGIGGSRPSAASARPSRWRDPVQGDVHRHHQARRHPGGPGPTRQPPRAAHGEPDRRPHDGEPVEGAWRRHRGGAEGRQEGQGAAHQPPSGPSRRRVRPATTSRTSSAQAATAWLSDPRASRKRRPSPVAGWTDSPTSSDTTTVSPVRSCNAAAQRRGVDGHARVGAHPRSEGVEEHRRLHPPQRAGRSPAGKSGAPSCTVRHAAGRRARCRSTRATRSASSPTRRVAT